VLAIELGTSGLVVRTRNPLEFFGFVGELVCQHQFQVNRMRSLDTGADAVFDYLQQQGGA
jgi:hypothetical protein